MRASGPSAKTEGDPPRQRAERGHLSPQPTAERGGECAPRRPRTRPLQRRPGTCRSPRLSRCMRSLTPSDAAVAARRSGLVTALVFPGRRRRPRDRRQGGPADPGVAVQLDRGDRAGGLVRRAVDDVDAPAAAAALRAPACSGPPPRSTGCGLVGVALFALVVYSGLEGAQVLHANFNVDLHLRDLLGRHADRERAVRRRLRRASAPGAAARAALRWAARRAGRAARHARCCATPRWLGRGPSSADRRLRLARARVRDPRPRRPASTLASLSLAYFALMLLGMALFGIETWSSSRRRLRRSTSTCSRGCPRSSAAATARSTCDGR